MTVTVDSTIRGVDGLTMADAFNPEPIVYLSVTVPKFPNLFIVNGVRGKAHDILMTGRANIDELGNWAAGPALPSVLHSKFH